MGNDTDIDFGSNRPSENINLFQASYSLLFFFKKTILQIIFQLVVFTNNFNILLVILIDFGRYIILFENNLMKTNIFQCQNCDFFLFDIIDIKYN